MPLERGLKLGPYEIEEAIGAGGMGEVYRAVDTRLDRTVAIKVLPGHMAENPELRQRLEREAKAVSSLTHPNVCALYDLGHHEGVDFLVMEFIDGETLAERLTRGPLPTAEVLKIGTQIADALEKAHRAGIIHRDLKPGNIMLTRDGAKLLDFGLAKADAPSGSDPNLTVSPTVSQPLTAVGTVLGTYQYMAPEQLEGQEVDARTDIFAFGAVLYEMVTGTRAFSGGSQATLIGAILHQQPEPASSIQPMIPPALDRVIQTCLAKDPEDRLQTAHDVKLQLQWIQEGGSVAGLPAPVAARRKSREKIAWAAAAAAALLAAVFAAGFVLRAPEPPRTMRFHIEAPPDLPFVGSPRISPDGTAIAFRATDTAGQTGIWLRSLDSLEPVRLTAVEGGQEFRPFWSPDSRHIGFFVAGKLKKIPVGGGPAQTIGDVPFGADGTWSTTGDILFDGGAGDPIQRVSASGGVPKPVLEIDVDKGLSAVMWPEFLPDGNKFLFVMDDTDGERNIALGSLESKEYTVLGPTESRVQFVSPDRILYVSEDTLVVRPFDPSSGTFTGEPKPIADQVGANATGLAHFSASRDGTPRLPSRGRRRPPLLWRDRSGHETGAVAAPAEYASFTLSPSGEWLLVDVADEQNGNRDVWIHDLERGVTSRFTFDPADDANTVWSPDGRQVVFSSNREGSFDLYIKDASGAGEATLLLEDEYTVMACDWSRDGTHIAYMRLVPEQGFDIWALPVNGQGEPFPVVASQFFNARPSFSPDSKWITYQSDETGRDEIYVRPFPGPGGKWQVSKNGGEEPHWSADGREIFYLDPTGQLVSAPVTSGANFRAGQPATLFDASLFPAFQRNRLVVAPDGQRFLMLTPMESQSNPPTTVVLNWLEAIKD